MRYFKDAATIGQIIWPVIGIIILIFSIINWTILTSVIILVVFAILTYLMNRSRIHKVGVENGKIHIPANSELSSNTFSVSRGGKTGNSLSTVIEVSNVQSVRIIDRSTMPLDIESLTAIGISKEVVELKFKSPLQLSNENSFNPLLNAPLKKEISAVYISLSHPEKFIEEIGLR